MSRSKFMLAGFTTLLLSGCAPPMQFAGVLNGAQQVPPLPAPATGTVTATVYPSTRVMNYEIQHTGLSGPATGAHFHGPAAPGANAGVAVPFPTPASPIKGSASLTSAQVDEIMAGQWYANVHTAANPGGEIRGQLQQGVLPK